MVRLADLDYRPCVGLMIINDKNNIFTGQRLGYTSTAWQMPQGGIEKGETPLTAAYRELWEETSIKKEKVEFITVSREWLAYDLPIDLIPKLWNGLYKGQKQKWFLMKFLGADTDININTFTPEFSAWRWSSKEQLVKYIVPFKKYIYEQVIEEFKEFL